MGEAQRGYSLPFALAVVRRHEETCPYRTNELSSLDWIGIWKTVRRVEMNVLPASFSHINKAGANLSLQVVMSKE